MSLSDHIQGAAACLMIGPGLFLALDFGCGSCRAAEVAERIELPADNLIGIACLIMTGWCLHASFAIIIDWWMAPKVEKPRAKVRS